MTGAVHLSRRLVLERREKAPDGAGGFATAWVPLGAVWAEVTARTGREDFIAARPVSRVTYRIRVRATPPGAPSRPHPDQRFREGNRVFDIRTVFEADRQGRYLEIMAEEGILP
jgi:SPP1 family predicted phage head-tail adaptor